MSEPVTTAELRDWLRIVSTAEDATLERLIAAARARVEARTGRTLVASSLTLTRHGFPGGGRRWFEIPRSPVRSITSITYLNTAGASIAFSSGDWRATLGSEPARIYLDDDADWPATQPVAASVVVAYAAGYATPAAVPALLKTAVLWLAAWWYEQRIPVAFGSPARVPENIDAICAQFRVYERHAAEVVSIASA